VSLATIIAISSRLKESSDGFYFVSRGFQMISLENKYAYIRLEYYAEYK